MATCGDQESRIARSGLATYFRRIETLGDKRPEDYRALFRRHGISAERFLMVGNSLRSDIWPVLDVGASAVSIPHHLTWQHEAADEPTPTHPGYATVEHLGLLPDLLERLDGRIGASPGQDRIFIR